jgi:hypothetical protein
MFTQKIICHPVTVVITPPTSTPERLRPST